MATDRHSVSGDERLQNSKDKQVSLRWPMALDQRLDDLMERANDAGAGTNRRETIAAIVLAADYTPEELAELVKVYRTARVVDAPLNPVMTGDNVLEFRDHRPGPRTAF